MKNILILAVFLIVLKGYSQKEGQSFCDGIPDGKYLPLDVAKKKIFWGNTYYFEKMEEGTKKFHGQKYNVFSQEWKDGTKDLLFLREENGTVYQYREECGKEYILLDSKNVGQEWENSCKVFKRKIISFDAEFKTRYCHYKNLLALESSYDDGVVYVFYYQKGYGYVGASQGDKVISCVSPEWNKD